MRLTPPRRARRLMAGFVMPACVWGSVSRGSCRCKHWEEHLTSHATHIMLKNKASDKNEVPRMSRSFMRVSTSSRQLALPSQTNT